MSGSLNSFEQPTGFTKYIGTKPVYGDGKNWYATMAAASAYIVSGDKILVVNGYTVTTTEIWNFSNVTIVFMPNQYLTFNTGVTTRAINIQGNSNRINDLWVKVNVTPLTSAIEINGTDNQLYSPVVENTVAGTLTNAFNLIGLRNSIFNEQLFVTAGAITNRVVFGSTTAGTMFNVSGYSRILSPTQSSTTITNPVNIDCSSKHIFYLSAPASPGTYTININSMVEGQTVNIIIASNLITYTITWSPTIIWGPTGKPTPTVASSKYDFYTLIKVGNSIFGAVVLAMVSAP